MEPPMPRRAQPSQHRPGGHAGQAITVPAARGTDIFTEGKYGAMDTGAEPRDGRPVKRRPRRRGTPGRSMCPIGLGTPGTRSSSSWPTRPVGPTLLHFVSCTRHVPAVPLTTTTWPDHRAPRHGADMLATVGAIRRRLLDRGVAVIYLDLPWPSGHGIGAGHLGEDLGVSFRGSSQ